jgi:hypothetical protein
LHSLFAEPRWAHGRLATRLVSKGLTVCHPVPGMTSVTRRGVLAC